MTVVAALSAKQTGAKQITLTLGKAVSEAPAVTVKKGAVTVSLATKDGIVLSSDGKTVVLTTNSAITADKYIVTIGDNSSEFTGEASKVVSIEISGDDLVLSATATNPTAANDTATASYVVKNQFGEDVSKNETIASNDSTKITASNGTITYKAAGGEKVGDSVAVVLYNTATGVSTSKVLKLSNKSAIASLSVKGIYNKDGKTLSEDIDLSKDAFYVLLDAKDQYGKAVTATTSFSDVVVNSVSGLTKTSLANSFAKVTVDGVDYLGIQINGTAANHKPAAGTETVIVIAKSNGQSVTTSYTVANGVKVDTFDFSIPEMVVAGEKTTFEFSATDTYGNAVTDVTKLSEMTGSHSRFNFEKGKDGKAILVYDATNNSQSSDTIESAMFITATNKVATKTFTLKAAATPKAIVNVKDVALGVLNVANNKVTIAPKNIVVEDQYGRAMDADKVGTAITIESNDSANAIFTGSNTLTTGSSNGNDLVLALPATNSKAGTESFTLKIDNVTNSDYTITLTSVEQKDIVSYAIADIKTVYTNGEDATTGNYCADLKVEGTLSNGVKVVVPASEYSVLDGTNFTYSNGKIAANANLKNAALKTVDEITDKVTVVVNANAEEITKEFKISKVAPAIASAKLDNVDEITLSENSELSLASLVTNAKIKVTDQYGVESSLEATGNRLSITDISDATNVAVKNNGTSNATTDMNAAGSYTATAKITFAGGYTFTFKVNFSKTA